MTADAPSDRDPVEVLAAEFVERLRLGEHPSVAEYTARHPELAGEIEALFPTIAEVECLKTPAGASSFGRGLAGAARPERLGDFHILREIGRGGMGIVYEARQESLGRRVAVKVLPRLATLDPKHLRRFRREARTAAGLHHTNIVPVFGVGQQDEYHYYVMQYIEGAGLDRVLDRLEHVDATSQHGAVSDIVREQVDAAAWLRDRQSDGAGDSDASAAASSQEGSQEGGQAHFAPKTTQNEPVPGGLRGGVGDRLPVVGRRLDLGRSSHWDAVAEIGIQVADALAYAHGKGVLHRDIKPANLIVETQGVVWVADFGLAKALEQEHLSRTGDVLGTPAYMAPEQLRGRTDQRSDVYSLGLSLYELVTLRSAFPESDRSRLLRQIATEEPARPRQVRPEIPRDLETIILEATRHEPERRYQSAAEMRDDLHRFLEGRPIQARRTTSVERLWLWCRRNPVVAGLSATAAALLLLVAVTASVGYVRTARALAGERAERERAEAATDLAVQVLDRIYERFAPNPTVAPGNNGAKPVLSEATAAVLENLLVFYDRLAEQSGGDGRYLEKIALANQRVGDIRHHLGQLDQAQAAYERALELYDQLDQAAPDKPHAFERATALAELGIVCDRLHQRAKAVESWQAAVALLREVEEGGTATPEIEREMARARALLARPDGIRRPPRGPSENPFGPPAPSGRPLGPAAEPPGPGDNPFGPPRPSDNPLGPPETTRPR